MEAGELMSQWHREHPELTGTDADPWMIHEDYRRLAPLTNNTDVAASHVTLERDEMPEPRDARAMMPHIFGQE
jgi:hypothetical protein